MNIILVDDEPLARGVLENAIHAATSACVSSFASAAEALGFASKNTVDVAFLDIEMPGISGLPLALRLKEINPKVNIVFVTGYSEYMSDAFSQHASGYLLKPAGASDITKELENLRHPLPLVGDRRVRVQCFGNFEVFVDGKPLAFGRAKAKELLAYLVDRRGASVRSAEISSTLWEDQAYTRSRQQQVQVVIGAMMKTLKEHGVEDIVARNWNSIAVVAENIDCDFYRLLDGEPAALNAYLGEYMSNYSWAEFTTGYLSAKMPQAE